MNAIDSVQHWIVHHAIPLGTWATALVNALKDNFQGLFNVLSSVLGFLLDTTTAALDAVPAIVLIVIFAGLTWYFKKSWKLALFVLLALAFVLNQGYWERTLETISLVAYATLACMLIGMPLGVAAAHHPTLYRILRPVLDLMQTLPTFVYLIPTLVLFGLGSVPGLISTIVFVAPTPVRLTYVGISNVPRPLIEAGQAFGASPWELLWKVEIPAALPTILAGLTQVIMLSLSMVVIAALVGAGGLGEPVVEAMETVQIGRGFTSGLAIVILAVILDRVFRPERENA
ncbi:MAG TPA: choline ABC transporter permease subunit [Acidiphilium sp.]|jgi:glycine betaine/proline transport system permease protein|uniref:choline ABC transporter permease subunit n=1 Tax=unclassified Acidiphilium TaxID=2617493 RepID=UPI000BD9E2E0|nr:MULTISPECIES: choline ABC transporter permease subunit [unclassified Acidiphilium]OYV54889.1 MAG: choline ABC transporter permease subunit [Acidiphilium sp. 20-67-58]OYV86710.1 MAG: choline ABC transporter permease subunit [Acidiphilium sp. 21-68-69]HQT62308.1 choline ABC transporter permease subunit [Acidiphilium sp.]HQU11853.1 choline ABC transporter permease subunit [Acidiphilium sp.]